VKSTDMFVSAKSRKTLPNPIVLPEQNLPEGKVVSPYVIDLWKDQKKKKVPKKPNVHILNPGEIYPLIPQKTAEELAKEEAKKLIEARLLEKKNREKEILKYEESEESEDRREYRRNEDTIKENLIIQHQGQKTKEAEKNGITFNDNKSHESDKINASDASTPPTREAQIAKVKQAMNQFEVFQKTGTGSDDKGFFRNLKKIL
jgi:hypothetical protein